MSRAVSMNPSGVGQKFLLDGPRRPRRRPWQEKRHVRFEIDARERRLELEPRVGGRRRRRRRSGTRPARAGRAAGWGGPGSRGRSRARSLRPTRSRAPGGRRRPWRVPRGPRRLAGAAVTSRTMPMTRTFSSWVRCGPSPVSTLMASATGPWSTTRRVCGAQRRLVMLPPACIERASRGVRGGGEEAEGSSLPPPEGSAAVDKVSVFYPTAKARSR